MTRAVLFVDDEQRILDGLRRGLRDLRHTWEMRFALGGQEAVAALDDDLTVVVSDMRMPDLDGADVLLAARERAPRAARVILSGNSERGAALRAACVAHRFVAKPCEAATLRAVLTPLDAALSSAHGVAALQPPVSTERVTRLRAVLASGATPAQVAAQVGQDPALALHVLHVTSSAFFGPARPVADLVEAVEHLGAATLGELLDEPGLLRLADAAPTPAPTPDTTVGALVGLAGCVPTGALLPLLVLRGLDPGLVARVGRVAA